MGKQTKQANSAGPVKTMGFNVPDTCHCIYWEDINEPMNYNKELASL